MAWIRRSTYHWIAIVYLALLTTQATGFSACQDKPQEIHIAKGKKVTVVYWVGQNALDNGAIEGKFASEIPPTTNILEETSATAAVTTESSSEVKATTESSSEVKATTESSSEVKATTESSSEAEATTESSSEAIIAQSADDESVSARHGGISTEPNLENAETERGTERSPTEAPSTALPGTHQTPVLNSNALGEDGITSETPELTSERIDITGRNNLEEESTTPIATPEATLASEADITTAIDLTTASTQAEEGSTTVLGPRSDAEGITSEVEYWSTTPVSEEPEEDSTGAENAEVTTGGRISKLDDATEIAANTSSEESSVTEAFDGPTSGTGMDDLKSPEINGTSELPTETTASSEDPRSGKLDEIASTLSVEETTEASNVENETNVNDLSPKSLNSNIVNETVAEVSIENATEAINNASEVTISGRQHEVESSTDADGTTSSSEIEQVTGAEFENSTQGIEGRLAEGPVNETESTNSSSSSPISLDFRAAADAETVSPITDGTESAEIVSEESSQPSVLEVISSTFKSLLSTLAPSTDASVDEDASSTEQTLDSRDSNVTEAIPNLESTDQDLSNETFAGRGQDNSTSENADNAQEPLEGRENDSNATLAFLELEANNANETIEGREQDVSSSGNGTTTYSPEIIFRNTTTELNATIEPRNVDNATAEELTTTATLSESSEDAAHETAAIPTEPPIAIDVIEDITEDVFNSQRVVTDSAPAAEYDESEFQDAELDEPDNRPIDDFDAPPSDIFIPIGQSEADGAPENDGFTEEARKIESYPMDNFEAFMHHNAPDLLRIPADESQYEKESRKKEIQGDNTKQIHFLRPSLYNSRNPFPPPYLMQFPARRSENVPHPFSGYLSPPVFADDLQPQPSASGPFYPSYFDMSSVAMPPESPVHYVSIMRPPDGVLPIRSLRMSPAQRGSFHETRSKREIHANATNCQWNFKSDPGVPLLLTFKSFSTPETPDCEEHYIAVERESNGFQSRWCGVSGERPGHASFARSEINLNLYSNGDGSFPTGFSVEVQALDLKLLRKYAEVRRIIKHQ